MPGEREREREKGILRSSRQFSHSSFFLFVHYSLAPEEMVHTHQGKKIYYVHPQMNYGPSMFLCGSVPAKCNKLQTRVGQSTSSTKYLKYRVLKSILSTKYIKYMYWKYFLVLQVFKCFFFQNMSLMFIGHS